MPHEAWYAPKLAATKAEDCGTCTQITVTFAERDGVAPALLAAVLAGNERAMSAEAALGFRFAEAVLARDPGADALRIRSSAAGAATRWSRSPSPSPARASSRR